MMSVTDESRAWLVDKIDPSHEPGQPRRGRQNPVKFIGNVATATGSHGVAYDETNGIVYTQDQNPNEGALFSFPAPK